MRKLLTLLPVAALALAAGCQDQPTSLRHPGQVAAPDAPELAQVTGASFTTDNPGEDDPRGCAHGNLKDPTPAVNCNLYNAKEKVWINGGPKKVGPSALTEGIYFFAIVEPGGQGGNNNPNDGTPKNLSDTDPQGGAKTSECNTATGTGCGDAYKNRRFRVGPDGDIVEFLGTGHRTSTKFQSTNGLMIAPYYFDDTSNPGGVYILAICRLGDVGGPETYPVEPSNCKYDAFKVVKGSGPPSLDAIITIEPDATNGIGEQHTFTITAAGLGGVPDFNADLWYTFDITTNVSPNPDSKSSTCGTPTVINPSTVQCTLTINNNSAGTFTANASVTVKDHATPQQTATATTNGENGSSGPAIKKYVDASLSWEKVDDSKPAEHIAGAVFTIERIKDRFGTDLSPSDPIILNIEDCVAASDAACTGPDKDKRAGYFRVDHLPFGTWRVTETTAPDGYKMADPASQDVEIIDLKKPNGSLANAFVNPKIPPLVASITIKPDATNGIGEPHTFTITAKASGGTPNPDASASPKYSFTITTSLDQTPDSQSSTCDNPTVKNDAEVSCTLTINNNTVGTFVANASVTVKDYGTPPQTATATTDGQNDNSGPATKTYVDASLSWEKVDDSKPGKHLAGAVFKIERTKDRSGTTLNPSNPIITNITDCIAAPCTGADKDERAGYFRVENLPFGTWKITETQAPAGYNLANPAYQTVAVTNLEEPTNKVTLTFINPGKYSGETATGGGYPWSATIGAPSNWFMYSPWAVTPFDNLAKLAGPFNIGLSAGTVPLIAGQQYIAGTITATRGTTTSITVTLANGFRFAGVSNNVKIQPMSCTKSQKYVQPGQFSAKRSAAVGQNSLTVTGLSNTECYGIHVDVERPLFPI